MCKRLVSILLSLLILFSTLCACSSGITPELLSFIPEVETDADFGGKEFKIVGLYREGIIEIAPVKYESEYYDKLLDHYDAVGKKFNLKIIAVGSNNITEELTLKSVGGDRYADIVDDSLSGALNNYNSDLTLEVTDIIGYSELHSGKYGTETQLDSVTLKRANGDETFAFVAAYWGLPTPKFANAGYFNPDFIGAYNLTNPYELLENDQWTWKVFEDMCVAVQSEGSDPADELDDIYGIAEDPDQNYLAKTAFASNDANLVNYNPDTDMYEFSLEDPAAEETLEWLKKMYDNGGLRIISGLTTNTSIGNVVNNFIEGRAMFMVEHTYHGTTDRESLAYRAEFEFSWIPFPKGPSATEYNYGASVSGADRYFFFPSVGADEDRLKIVVPYLFNSFEGLGEYDWRDYFSFGMFFSDESQEWFFYMYDNVTNNYDFLTGFFNTSYSASAIQGKKSISEILQTYGTSGQKEVDKYLNDK